MFLYLGLGLGLGLGLFRALPMRWNTYYTHICTAHTYVGLTNNANCRGNLRKISEIQIYP